MSCDVGACSALATSGRSPSYRIGPIGSGQRVSGKITSGCPNVGVVIRIGTTAAVSPGEKSFTSAAADTAAHGSGYTIRRCATSAAAASAIA
jgi:hypothetical protein